jgi:predicted nucleotidyltransferase
VATTIASSFQQMRSNLEITSLQQSTVSTRQQNVRDAVARRLVVKESFITGSYKRHTMISPLTEADIDIFVVLDPQYFKADGYEALLDRVRAVLLETYPSTPRISRNGQAVTITFTDFVVDVVSAFYRKDGGFLIPSTSEQRWISTDPRVHETMMSQANAAHDGNLVPIVKMIKAWNRQINSGFMSFYLELLVEQVLRGVTISNDPSACRFVFDKGRELIRYRISDPAGLDSDQIPGLLSVNSIEDAVSRFTTAYNRAIRAENFAGNGKIADAVDEWRKVFGDYFPAYG